MRNQYLIFAAMGIELVSIIMATLWLGQKIDEIYGFEGKAGIILSLIGLVGWLLHIVFLLKKLENHEP